mmetsp:Transcript_47547/g.57574  ORF Transcript_47547/g.57574 Transcript_47547/m.57574 type:complete len:217 (-) Transcript_47547:619-1269(-)
MFPKSVALIPLARSGPKTSITSRTKSSSNFSKSVLSSPIVFIFFLYAPPSPLIISGIIFFHSGVFFDSVPLTSITSPITSTSNSPIFTPIFSISLSITPCTKPFCTRSISDKISPPSFKKAFSTRNNSPRSPGSHDEPSTPNFRNAFSKFRFRASLAATDREVRALAREYSYASSLSFNFSTRMYSCGGTPTLVILEGRFIKLEKGLEGGEEPEEG